MIEHPRKGIDCLRRRAVIRPLRLADLFAAIDVARVQWRAELRLLWRRLQLHRPSNLGETAMWACALNSKL